MSQHLRNAQTRFSGRWTQIEMVNCPLKSLLRERRTIPPSSGCFSATPAVLGSRKLDFSHCSSINLTNFQNPSQLTHLRLLTFDHLSYGDTCTHTHTYTHATVHATNTKCLTHIYSFRCSHAHTVHVPLCLVKSYRQHGSHTRYNYNNLKD